jgi:drug/metabolite transporter (DMT)-like permease
MHTIRRVVSVLFALGAAFANALNVVTQHVASVAAPARDKGWRLALYLIRSPLWLLGVGAMVGGFVFQAVALDKGRLSVVQSILVTELVFSLVLGRLWLKRDVPAAAWASASVTSAGLAVFLVASEPKGGHPGATAGAWMPALLFFGGLAATCTVLGGSGPPMRRAALYAGASGIVWAVMATFLKSGTEVLATSGPLAVLEHGAVYGVVITGVIGTVLTQAALHVGPLAVSQPIMVIVDPFVSIVLGIWLYGEHFTGASYTIVVGALGFAAMVVGVVFLARTAPSFEATPVHPGSQSSPTDVR